MKNMEKISRGEIGRLLLDLMSEYAERDAQPGFFGTDTRLYHSEIHLLAFIEKHPGLHPSGIARALGRTRGAVSQTVKRLVQKGFLEKRSDPGNSRRILLFPTEKGFSACRFHAERHRKYENRIAVLLENADPAQLSFLRELIVRLKRALR